MKGAMVFMRREYSYSRGFPRCVNHSFIYRILSRGTRLHHLLLVL